VLGYTIWGGMWSVALTDLFQSVVILLGLTAVAWLVATWRAVQPRSSPPPRKPASSSSGRKAARGTGCVRRRVGDDGIGSIPQQDVFQRVTSAKDEKTAIRGCLVGGLVYFVFAFVPIFIAYSALIIEPDYARLFSSPDAREIQRILPDLILSRTPMWRRCCFSARCSSAILSTQAAR